MSGKVRKLGEEEAGNEQGNQADKARGLTMGDNGPGFPGAPTNDMMDGLGPALALVAQRKGQVGFGFENHGER